VDQIFDRFERLFKSWVSGSADGRTQHFRHGGDSDFDAAMDELDDYLDAGRSETEARDRDRARREREEAARRAAASSSAHPHGPPTAIVQAYRSLGLAYGAPFPEVKAAYKRLLMQNHPDRNSATAEQIKRSTEISVQINSAYQRIKTWNDTGTLDEN